MVRSPKCTRTDTGLPVIYDPDSRANHNIFVAGTTGSGKSFTMKIIVMRFLEKRPDIMTVIIDPQGEYLPHAKYFGLDSLEIKPGKQYGLDPFKLFDTPIEAADIIGIVTEAPIEVKKEWRSICDGINNLDELYEKSSEKAKKYLAVTLVVIFVWFVIIDNLIIPAIQHEITNSYQNGYNTGVENSITEIFQQTSNCQSTYIWVANNTRHLIDVACLQSLGNSEISNNP